MFSLRHILTSLVGGVVLAASASLFAADAPATDMAAKAAVAHSTGGQWGFLNEYCSECHNATDWAGGVAFDTMQEQEIPQNAETMEHAVRKLRGRLMPPPGKPQPDLESLRSFVSWMENNLDQAAQANPDPGRVGLHRLNRKEYANAVRDLLDLQIDPVALLPRDDTEDGFDNVAHALQVSPSFLDQYLAAARSVAVQAIGNRSARPAGSMYAAKNAGSQQFHREGLPLGTRGGMVVDHYFPADGEYVINIGNMAQALWVYNMEFENTLVVTIDGRQVYETNIGGEEDMKAIDQKQDPAVDAINSRLKNIRFNATAGTHKVGVTFRQRTFAESEDRLFMHVPGGGQDRVLKVTNFEVRGPFEITGVSDTASRKRVFACYPKSTADEQPCAEKIISTLARRAFRRPLNETDKQELLGFYKAGRAAGDFEAGIRRALTAILANPDFLYRAEIPPQQVAPGATYQLTDLDLASRLSFFLWSSVPDDELLDVATRGQLRDPQVLAAQVRRMLADARAETLVSNFAFQWLNVPKLEEIEPDARVFPYASGPADPREDFRTELRLFIGSIFQEDRSVVDLLTADHTYLNERLALHYDVPDVKGDRFRRVTLSNSKRNGLLGKGGILMLTSYPTRTAPVLRGAWILERITGTPPAPPPPNVEALKENQAGSKEVKTIRELMADHSVKPNCHACHGVMDPLGFALENFDATGKYRELDRYTRSIVDTSGQLPDGTKLQGPDDLRKALIARPDQFVQTFTEKLMTYALGRRVEYRDMPLVRAIVRQTAPDNYRFSSLVMNIVTSDAFQKKRVPGGEEQPLSKQPVSAATTAAHP
jgi:mono/diheme cytochrome c family protein